MNNCKHETYHVPVLLKESIDGLNIIPSGIYVDVTFGGGGHSCEILSRIGSNGHLFSFDQDADAEINIENTKYIISPCMKEEERDVKNDTSIKMEPQKSISNLSAHPNFTFIRSNFRFLKNWMKYYEVERIDGLLADLGVSSHHFDDETRGFSYRFDAPLDMRMNKQSGKTAADILNTAEEEKLADIFHLYGELKNSRHIAAAIIKARKKETIRTTYDLIRIVKPMFKCEREKRETAKLFQALRIEVNHEMSALKEMLLGATELLRPGGRLSVITYHSLEDRIVKNIVKSGNAEGKIKQDFFGKTTTPFRIIEKVIYPTAEEQKRNPRSRSAKLRIAEKRQG